MTGQRSAYRIWLVAEAVALLLVASIRFDYRDPGIVGRFTSSVHALPGGHGIDVEGYTRLVEYFRGSAPADSMIPPFCFRTLAPLAASAIPARPLTALNFLNLACLLGAFLLLEDTLRRLNYRGRTRAIGGAVFAISFPTFYYTTIGFIDPVAIFSVALLITCVIADAPIGIVGAIAVLAALVKETNAAFSLLPLAFSLARGRRGIGDLWPRALIPVACVAAVLGVHALAPFPDAGFIWKPRLSSVVGNLSRPRTYLSLGLTVFLPAVLATVAVVSGRAQRAIAVPERRVLELGCALATAMYLYSLCSAYTDGRIIWIVYPFAIPIAASWFEDPARAPARYPSV